MVGFTQKDGVKRAYIGLGYLELLKFGLDNADIYVIMEYCKQRNERENYVKIQ